MKPWLFIYILSFLLVTTSCKTDEVFLFSYFVGNGEDGLHYASSADGYRWEKVQDGKSFLAPRVGTNGLMRDPCLFKGPDGDYHLVWTTGWGMKGVGYARSKDLVHWSGQQYIPVMEHEPTARNCWAPEITFDPENNEYMIYWATTIPNHFPETNASSEDNYNHRIYYVTTKDFTHFSETKLLYDQGFNVIDASIYKVTDGYMMLLKDETLFPPQKNLRIASSKHLTGPYSLPSPPITGDYWAEGPTAIKKGNSWIVYFDKYKEGKYGAIQSHDLKKWTDISSEVSFPEGVRHGTVIKITGKQFNEIKIAR